MLPFSQLSFTGWGCFAFLEQSQQSTVPHFFYSFIDEFVELTQDLFVEDVHHVCPFKIFKKILTAIFPACWLMTWLYEYQLTRSSGQNHNSSRGKKKKEKDLLLAYHHISCLAYPHLHSCCRICGKNWMPLLYTSTPLLPVIPLLGQAGRQKPQNGCNTIVELWHIFSFKKKKKRN